MLELADRLCCFLKTVAEVRVHLHLHEGHWMEGDRKGQDKLFVWVGWISSVHLNLLIT
jgi:hypothetical protein